MKHPIFFTLLLYFAVASATAQPLTQTGKLASLCKVWGFFKYFHPALMNGRFNWDKQLIEKLPLVEAAKGRQELDNIYTSWLHDLGNLNNFEITSNSVPKTFTTSNTFLTWLDDTSYIDSATGDALNEVVAYRNRYGNYYAEAGASGNVHFTHETDTTYSAEPDVPVRLLALFRYWNMIEYYYPYKYLIGNDWQQTLEDLIPVFEDKAHVPYEKALQQMTASIHDSHAGLMVVNDTSERYWTPFAPIVVDGRPVVKYLAGVPADSLQGVTKGDIITAIADTPVGEYMEARRKYIGAANDAVFYRNVVLSMISHWRDTVTMTIEHNGVAERKKIYLHKMSRHQLMPYYMHEDTTKPYKALPGDIGYINMGILHTTDVRAMYDAFKNKRAVIFDLRNYPKGTLYDICGYFSHAAKPFAKFTAPDFSCPGTFKLLPGYSAGPHGNKYGYDGKIIVLVNEMTQSHAEFTCMALKTLGHVTVIGSQTAGADGDVSEIQLPGGYSTYISGIGVYYPDCTVAQRIGIIPDIAVKPTIDGIKQNRDEVLERAISFINNGK